MTVRVVNLGSLAPGVNNRLEPTQLDTRLPDRTKATYLYGADNVDINEKGFMRRRRGTQTVLAQSTHSIWSAPPFTEMYGVVNDELVLMREGGTGVERTTVVPNMPRLPVSFSRGEDDDVYWSNGLSIRRISNGQDKPIHTPPPDIPQITPGTGGALSRGQYLVGFTATEDGVESALANVQQVDVPEGGRIDVAAVGPVNLYMSGPNGGILTFQQTLTVGSVYTVTDDGRRAQAVQLDLLPAGNIVRHYNGRMLVASGQYLYASEPYLYGLYNANSGYFGFSADITVVEPTDNGVYIVADRSFWVNDLFSDTLQEVLPYGALPNTSVRSPNNEEVYWQSERGLIRADKNMTVTNVQEEALRIRGGSGGATLYRERNGQTHVVATRDQVPVTKAVAFTYMDAEVVRKGTEL